MKYLKLFESYFDSSDSTYDIITYNQKIDFENSHELVSVSNDELNKVNDILGVEYICKLVITPSIGMLYQPVYQGDDYVKANYVSKFDDDWWVVAFDRWTYESELGVESNKVYVLCDGLEGMSDYMSQNQKVVEK